MNVADRLSVVTGHQPGARPRWSIKWDNQGRTRDLFILNFNPVVPKETADAVLALLQQDEHLQRVLK